MGRMVLAVVVGFLAWAIGWVGGEKILSATLPEWFGAHQRAFKGAVANGGAFTADTPWPYAPIWYHAIFTALLIPMTMMGGKLRSTT